MKSMAAVSYRAEIDGLRCFAVLPVVLFHADVQLFKGGFVGVDVFFVISGYLITSIIGRDLAAGAFSFKAFYRRRAWRILPALFLVMLASTPVAWFLMAPFDYRQYSTSVLSVLTFASNFLFWKQSGYFEGSDVKPLIHTWSLGVEEQFYIVFPIVLVLLWSLGRRAVWLAIAAGVLVSLGLCEYASRTHPNFDFYLPVTRAWELGVGALCCFLPGARNRGVAQALSVTGLSLILASVFLLDGSVRFPSLFALPVVGGAALVLVFATRETFVGRLLSLKPLVGIGLVSYSAYLWHQPVFAFWRIYSGTGQDAPHYAVLIGLVFALAYLTWKYVETPCRRAAASPGPARQGRMRLAMACLAVALASAGTVGTYLVPSYAKVINPRRFESAPASSQTETCPGFQALSGDAWCERIGAGPLRLVIWGDSHAGMLAPAISPHPSMSVFVVSVPGCPPLINVRRVDEVGTASNCSDPSRSAAYAEFVKQVAPDAVVLVARWTMYTHGWRRLGVPQIETHLLARDRREGPEIDESRRALSSGLIDTSSFLNTAGRLYVLEQIPDMQGLSQFRRSTLDSTPRAPISDWHGIERKIMNEAAAASGLQLIDPTSLFCDEDRCQLVLDGRQLYLDDNHMSVAASRPVWEEIRNKVFEQVE